jgi:hypothetical protein
MIFFFQRSQTNELQMDFQDEYNVDGIWQGIKLIWQPKYSQNLKVLISIKPNSPMLEQMESIQNVLTITRIQNFDMHQMDVKISFYNGDF